jgi:glutaconate CoA-transferase, subunit A
MTMLIGLDELISRIPDGARMAIASDFNGFYSGAAMEATRGLVRRGARGLCIVAVPTTGLQVDLLIGAGCVAEIECGAVIHGEHGATPRFLDAFAKGALHMKESTCPAIFHGLTAAEKGAPFMPVRGVLGTDIPKLRPEWRTLQNPFDESEPLVVVPAIHPDVALFHAPMADCAGNIWIGRRREFALMAHASRSTLVTVERIYDGDLMAHKELSAGALANVYIDGVAVCERGAWPFHMGDDYPEDADNIRKYLQLARTEEGFRSYLDEHVLGRATA